jgi:glycosyltransferase involved in cell wall biosynthesis
LTVKRLCNSISEYSPNLVHVFKPKGYAGIACTWMLMKGRRSVVLDCDDWEGWGGWNDVKAYPWVVKEYIDRQEKWLMRRAPVVTSASRILEQRAVELRGTSARVFYVPNCGPSRQNGLAQESAFSMATSDAKQSFRLPTGPAILYSGHFEAADDVMFFCRAVSRPAARYGAVVVFVGEGPDLARVKQFFAGRNDVNVRFFPRLPYEDFVRLIAACEIAAFPYPDNAIYQSKCSVRIVDYMCMGRAVVTTAIGQNNEYIIDGESGILVPPNNEGRFSHELERLLGDDGLRTRIGSNARRRIKAEFLWAGKAVENCLSAYRLVSRC